MRDPVSTQPCDFVFTIVHRKFTVFAVSIKTNWPIYIRTYICQYIPHICTNIVHKNNTNQYRIPSMQLFQVKDKSQTRQNFTERC